MTTATDVLQTITLTQLRESTRNPRRHYDPKKLEELTASVKQAGVRVPLVVRPIAASYWRSPTEPLYEIGAGHRRYRAAKKAGVETVPVLIQELDDDAFLELLSFENLNREDLHPFDEAVSFNALLESQGGAKWDAQAIADKIGKSLSYVYMSLRLLKLVKPVREAFLADKITAGHANDIVRLAPDDQLQALKAATWDRDRFAHPLSVRELRDHIQREIVRDLGKAPFDTKDAQLVPAAGACGPCPKRAANNPELFGEIAKGDRCMDGTCFTGKVEAWLDGIRATAKAGGQKVVDIKVGYNSQGKGLGIFEYQRAGEKPCDDAALGIVVDGDYTNPIGTVLKICLKREKCKVHNARAVAARSSSRRTSARSSATPAAPKVTLQERVHRRMFDAIRHKVKTPLGKADLELVAADLLMFGDGLDIIEEAYGWKHSDLNTKNAMAKPLAKLPQADLNRLLLECIMAREIADTFAGTDALDALARRYGVSEKKIEAELKAEDAAKAKAGKAAPATKGKAGKKAKKK